MRKSRLVLMATIQEKMKQVSSGSKGATRIIEDTSVAASQLSATTLAQQEWVVKDVHLAHKYADPIKVDVVVTNAGRCTLHTTGLLCWSSSCILVSWTDQYHLVLTGF